MLWLAILLPDLPLQVFTRGLRDVPAIAITADKPGAPLIAASASAQAAGIRPGQHATSASALLPELRLHARVPQREAEALNEIASWAGRFTPRVSLSSPDAVLLEIASCLRLFGSAHDITTQVASGLAALGFHARIGLAPTPLAARWFARCGHPAGEDWLQAIDQLPLSVLEDEAACDADTRALLAGLGLHSLGEVRDLPAAGLA
ncbi:MAG TPA: DNA polymerase Y family protein, partial [Thauera sp.]|nr:DNA polymerase Y family protein [Thauera sp.]